MKLIIAGISLLGIPAFYLIRIFRKENSRKKKQMELGLAYDRLVRQAKLSIEHAEMLEGKLVALDRKNKKLLLIDHNQVPRQEDCISLLGIESCRVIEVKKNPDAHTRKVILELKHKWIERITRFSFYDESSDAVTELPLLVRRAKSWKHRLDLHKYPGSVGLELEYVL
jgi:hypothetical protein